MPPQVIDAAGFNLYLVPKLQLRAKQSFAPDFNRYVLNQAKPCVYIQYVDVLQQGWLWRWKMFYPVYLHLGDDTHAHGVTIPDFPGCFTAADSLQALPHAIQEAAEVYFAGRAGAIPPPTQLERLMPDPAYRDGVWVLVDLDIAKLGSFPAAEESLEVKTGEISVSDGLGEANFARVAVTLPHDLLKLVDEYAGKHQLSRSAVLARAAMMFLTTSGS